MSFPKKTDAAINEAKGFENYQIIWQGEINFEFDAIAITPAAEQVLIEGGEKRWKPIPVPLSKISGHTDQTGSNKYNFMLGEQRANAAKRFLSERFGISLYRMFVISYGKQKPAALPDETKAASKNRRAVLTVWGELKSPPDSNDY